jgi:hypothetical protein
MNPSKCIVNAIFLSLIVSPAHAGPIQFLVVPTFQETATGNDSSGSLSGSNLDIYFQLVFGRGQFFSIPGSLLITRIAFRAKPDTGSIRPRVECP